MKDRLLLGIGRHLLPIPRMIWQRQATQNGRAQRAALAFMTENHHRVRNLAVVELPRTGAPLPPELFAARLNLPLENVVTILDELERRMTFLFRNAAGEVTWAYPVTVEPTPHHVTFSSGESLYAA